MKSLHLNHSTTPKPLSLCLIQSNISRFQSSFLFPEILNYLQCYAIVSVGRMNLLCSKTASNTFPSRARL